MFAAILASVLIASGEGPADTPVVEPIALEGLSPIDYRRLRLDAERAHAQRDWPASAEAFAALTAAYPYDGAAWSRLGVARLNAGDPAGAAAALAQAYHWGVEAYPENVAANAARAFARADKPEEAVAWLKVALFDQSHVQPDRLLREPVFDPLRGRADFLRLFGDRAAGAADRVEAWNKDLDFYLAETVRARRDLSPAAIADIEAAADQLRRTIPQSTDTEIAIGFQRLSRLQASGHSHFSHFTKGSPDSSVPNRTTPVRYELFSDGLVIREATPAFRHLIGARVINVGGVPAAEALGRLALAPRDNPMGDVWLAPAFLSNPDILASQGLSRSAESVDLELETPEGASLRVTLPALDEAVDRRGPGVADAPLYRARRAENFWMADLTDKAAYVQVNLIVNTPDQTVANFGRALGDRLRSAPPPVLILDLRNALGGNTYLYRELLRAVIAFDTAKQGRVYVITSRLTGSAAVNLATDLDRLTDAVFVGEPPSGSPIQPGDALDLALPNSRLAFGVSTTVWALTSPHDTRPWVAPDMPVNLSSADFLTGRDPALEAISQLEGLTLPTRL